ncbi:transcriptional regulator [Corallococcus exiguus]|uniref:protease inhibitor I42 family protein n=1 Tax=Corallococcus TaxID=83461 RepID=UPI000ED85296|nr:MULTISPECIES: protease inhibitor I42 family protein [Corallococcus]NNB96335.1 transcriptional regulator [Corallococcus exiguus]NNC05129.1 transcriptional regulator [Corallococcus exiguus]NPC52407.1 transcriptional regulator [Corallococcus exiguus]RKH81012.1 transcriptional regulator [Corallococcus sp. AB032C]RKI11438.1 transcriptional regulator [Corallococcus sp. AB030]
MAKPKSGAKKPTPAAKAGAKPAAKKDNAARLDLIRNASKKVATAATKVVKAVAEGAKGKVAAAKKAVAEKVEKAPAVAKKAAAKVAPPAPPAKAGKAAPAAKTAPAAPPGKKGAGKAGGKAPSAVPAGPAVEKPRPRATKLPPVGEPLTKREMEQLLTAGEGRGVTGEGSLKGRLVLSGEMPHLVVVGRDKRELTFLLQGPDQEVLPAYVDHKVSVSGLIKKTTNHSGVVEVRKYSAKKPEVEEVAPAPSDSEPKLRYLSPGEVSMAVAAGMGAGIKGFASIRGNLEMMGEDFVLVVSNGGTRQQVSFAIEGKAAVKSLRKHVGQTLQVTGVVDKTSGWGGRITAETVEPRPSEARSVSRDEMELVHIEGEVPTSVDVKLNHGLTVRLQEQPGATWAIEPTLAKRVGLREANFEQGAAGGPATREFFFTPRNPGNFEVEFFLAKAFTPGVVERSFKISVTVKP